MDKATKESGRMDYFMELDITSSTLEKSLRVSMKKAINMEKELLFIQMEINLLPIGIEARNTDRPN